MAKRPPRSQADESVAPALPAKAAPPAKAKSRARRRAPAEAVASGESDTASERVEGTAHRVQPAPGNALAARGDQRMTASAPTDEDIRARAYQMYLERGGRHGGDFEDWLRAEHELKRRQ